MTLEGSLASLRQAGQVARQADEGVDRAVAAAKADGASWQQIGDALGMSRQNAHRRFRRLAT